MHLERFIQKSVESNHPFVSYRLPGAKMPVTITQGKVEQIIDPVTFSQSTGFIIHPFVITESFPAVFFHIDECFEGFEFDFLKEIEPQQVNGVGGNHFVELEKAQYLQKVEELINLCQTRQLEKVVFSRILQKEIPDKVRLGRLFVELCKAYPWAFVYIFNLGNGQTWIGASPEILVTSLSGKCETISLAGTIATNQVEPNTEKEFTSKELIEQEMVTDYIVNILKNSNVLNLNKHKLETKDAGPVKHLLTRFSFDLPFGESLTSLAMSLHPTPAVCGLPLYEALKTINTYEPHQRAYYSGFLGPVNNKITSNLFVNLRCMVAVGQKAYIFAGGGITSGSDANSEWDETNLKSQTLIKIIEQIS